MRRNFEERKEYLKQQKAIAKKNRRIVMIAFAIILLPVIVPLLLLLSPIILLGLGIYYGHKAYKARHNGAKLIKETNDLSTNHLEEPKERRENPLDPIFSESETEEKKEGVHGRYEELDEMDDADDETEDDEAIEEVNNHPKEKNVVDKIKETADDETIKETKEQDSSHKSVFIKTKVKNKGKEKEQESDSDNEDSLEELKKMAKMQGIKGKLITRDDLNGSEKRIDDLFRLDRKAREDMIEINTQKTDTIINTQGKG